MVPSTYDGPSNGDYVTYVDKLLRASPDFRRTQHSIAGAIRTSTTTPGVQAGSPMGQLRDKLQKAKEMAEQAERRVAASRVSTAPAPGSRATQRAAGEPVGQNMSRAQARERFNAIEQEIEVQKAKASAGNAKPWISPFSIVLIVAGVVISQMAPGFGTVLSVMGLMSLVGGVIKKLKS